LRGPQQAMWFERLEREHDNLRGALQWAVEQGEADQSMERALRLCAALGWYWFVYDRLSEGRQWMERTLAGSKEVVTPIRGKVLSTAGLFALEQDDYERAEALCGESVLSLQELGDTGGLAFSLHILGLLARARRNYTTAQNLLEESLACSKKVGDGWSMAYALDDLASVAFQQREYARAAELAEEALTLFRKVGDIRGIAYSLYNLGHAIFHQGDATSRE
jgi:tetratricopeptide (TPR) repeat protein